MSQFSKVPQLTADEYLAHEARAEVRHEYVNGQIFAMTGATEAHNVISGNLYALLHTELKGSACRAFINDMKVKVELANSFYYPDIMVTCEPFDGKSVFKQEPILIAEVLSPSTSHIDRREKLVAYRQLSSLRQYLIVHQNKYRIESYRKDIAEKWEFTVLGHNDVLCFESLGSGFSVPVSIIYEGVALEAGVEEEEADYAVS